MPKIGLPAPALLALVKAWGATVLASATTVAEARWLHAHGADAVIAQGLEAGGHRGHFLSHGLSLQMGTFALLPQVLRAVPCPVIAAEGIADADGVVAARALGAAAVQLGTSFLLCDEASASVVHRAALQQPGAAHTALTNVHRPSGAQHRQPRDGRARMPAPAGTALPLGRQRDRRAACSGRSARLGRFLPLWADQNTSGCHPVPAAVLLRQLAQRCPT